MSASECSSAEEERRSRAVGSSSSSIPAPKKNMKREAMEDSAATFVPSRPTSDHSSLLPRHSLPAYAIPRMKDMSELLRDCQHLKQNVDGSPMCMQQMLKIKAVHTKQAGKRVKEEPGASSVAAAPQGKGSEDQDDLNAALKAAVMSKQPDVSAHWVDDGFKERIRKLPIPELYDESSGGLGGEATQEQLTVQLRREQFYLRTQSAVLECHLLAEAGRFISKTDGTEYNFPACMNGNQCVGMDPRYRVRGQKESFIYTMVMFDYEYENLMRSRQSPKGVARPCVQCTRTHLTAFTVFHRAERMCGEGQAGDSVLSVKPIGNLIHQFYRNLCDAPGGYHGIHMLGRQSSPDDPILDPICTPGLSSLLCCISDDLVHPETKKPRIVIDQSVLMWVAPTPPQPRIGENLLSFCGGASKF